MFKHSTISRLRSQCNSHCQHAAMLTAKKYICEVIKEKKYATHRSTNIPSDVSKKQRSAFPLSASPTLFYYYLYY